MILLALISIALLGCIVGWYGYTRKLGFWATLAISIIVTIGALIYETKRQRIYYQEHSSDNFDSLNQQLNYSAINPLIFFFLGPFVAIIIAFLSKKKVIYEKEILKHLQNEPHSKTHNANSQFSVADEFEKLSKLKSEGHLTEEEYLQLKSKIISQVD